MSTYKDYLNCHLSLQQNTFGAMIIIIMIMTKITRMIIIIIIIIIIIMIIIKIIIIIIIEIIIIKTIKFTNVISYHKPRLGSTGTVYLACLVMG